MTLIFYTILFCIFILYIRNKLLKLLHMLEYESIHLLTYNKILNIIIKISYMLIFMLFISIFYISIK